MAIYLPVLLLAAVGLLAGVGLSLAEMSVGGGSSEEETALLELLPGANCGVCGYPGCAGYAQAILKDNAPLQLCRPGGQDTVDQLSALLGRGADALSDEIAWVHCGGKTSALKKAGDYQYRGYATCYAFAQQLPALQSCLYRCVGLGDCVQSCGFDAIHIADGIAAVSPDDCVGCKACVESCPQDLISMVPSITAGNKGVAQMMCNSKASAKTVRAVCEVGCISCGLCVTACQYEAITLVQRLARIDGEKCVGCGDCVSACPQDCILLTTPSVAV